MLRRALEGSDITSLKMSHPKSGRLKGYREAKKPNFADVRLGLCWLDKYLERYGKILLYAAGLRNITSLPLQVDAQPMMDDAEPPLLQAADGISISIHFYTSLFASCN